MVMNKVLEQELILNLIDRYGMNRERVIELLKMGLDWEYVLGFLTYNRVAGIAYHNILECNPYEDDINREFRLNLFLNYNIQSLRTLTFRQHILEIAQALDKENIAYAFLKGAVFYRIQYILQDVEFQVILIF